MTSTSTVARKNSFVDDKNNFDQSAKILKPLPDPWSVKHVFLIVGLHLCKKIVFFNRYIRILAYLTCLFALSSIADVLPIPKIYSSSVTNLLNQYFVKLGWFWTLFVSVPFVFMTSYTYCCGKKYLIWRHLARLCIATFFWYFWVNYFVYLEGIYGYCMEKRNYKTKLTCVTKGFRWNGFDLSGHAFILIYSNLVIIEEARPILGWEGIRDLIRDESYIRVNKLSMFGPLRNLNPSEFEKLKFLYELFLPYIRLFFIAMAFLTIIWDSMLLSTILYFHSMPEKLLSGIIAIIMWYVTYEIWFKLKNIAPLSPGEGTFNYFTKDEKPVTKKRSESLKKKKIY